MPESFGGFQIAQAAFIIMMILFVWPRAKQMWKGTPKGSSRDWITYAALMAGIVLFIFLLVAMVRS